jgi:hypothetical protein
MQTTLRRTIQEEASGIVVRGHTLQQGQSIAHPVRGRGRELAGIQERVDRDDFLQQARHHACMTISSHSSLDAGLTETVPQNQSQLRHLLPLLAQLQQRLLARLVLEQLRDPGQHPAVLLAHELHVFLLGQALAVAAVLCPVELLLLLLVRKIMRIRAILVREWRILKHRRQRRRSHGLAALLRQYMAD